MNHHMRDSSEAARTIRAPSATCQGDRSRDRQASRTIAVHGSRHTLASGHESVVVWQASSSTAPPYLDEVLIARKSKRPFGALEVCSYVLLQRAARGRVRNREEVEHELGNGIRRCEIRRLDLRGNGFDQHLIRLAAPLLKLAGK